MTSNKYSHILRFVSFSVSGSLTHSLALSAADDKLFYGHIEQQ